MGQKAVKKTRAGVVLVDVRAAYDCCHCQEEHPNGAFDEEWCVDAWQSHVHQAVVNVC